MNQRAEVVLEGLIQERLYRLSLPAYSGFEGAFAFLDHAREELVRMEKVAQEQQKQQSAQPAAAE